MRNASTALLFSYFVRLKRTRNDLVIVISCRYFVGSGVLNSFGKDDILIQTP